MLPEPLRLLICAYAAGDLSPRRKSSAERLLRHSAEARRLLKDVRFNRRRLRMLPRPKLPGDFAEKVLAALPPEKPPIIRPSTVALHERSPVSATSRWAAAAVVLVALGLGAAVVVTLPGEPHAVSRSVAKRPNGVPGPEVAKLPPRAETDEPVPTLPEPAAPVESVVTNTQRPDQPDPAPPWPEPLGSVVPPSPRLTLVSRPRLAMLGVREFESRAGRQKFGSELAKGDAHHVDLFCKDTAKGLDRLQTALKAHGVKVHEDAIAHELAKRKIRAQFLIFCDDLTVGEWVEVLHTLSATDKKVDEGLFDSVVAVPLDAADKRELTAIAGTDLSQRDAKVLSAASKKDPKVALVAALAPRRTIPNSNEVKQFLETPAGRPAGAIAVVLTIRLVGP